MKYKKIVVAGGGILGSQIAFQSAYSNFSVTILIRKEDSKKEVIKKLNNLENIYIETINSMSKKGEWARGIADIDTFSKRACLKKAKSAINNIVIETDQEKALKDADLVIESITENYDVKVAFYKEIAPLLPKKTVVVTNSSTLLPSKLAKYTLRPDKYLSMHFLQHTFWQFIHINGSIKILLHKMQFIEDLNIEAKSFFTKVLLLT